MVQLQVKKPRAILFDISGTVAKSSFIDKVLMPYIKEFIRMYLEENYEQRNVRTDIENLRVQASRDDAAPKIPGPEAGRANLINATVAYVNYCADNKMENKAITLLRFHMWFDGYKRQRLETPVYSDVAIQIQKWRCDQEIKLFVFSNGWAEATKRFLSRTNHGDMNLLIDDHFDTTTGSLTDPATFAKVLDHEKVKEQPQDVLFLTKSPEEARAAIAAGLIVVMVLTHRRNIEKLDTEGRRLPRVRSFNEIEFV